MRKSTISPRILLALAVLVLVATGVNAVCEFDGDSFFGRDYRYKQSFEKTCPLPANGDFSLRNTNGTIVVSAWDKPEVEIKAEKSAAVEKNLDLVEIKVDAGARMVAVDTIYPRLRNLRLRVNYEIKVPAGARLELVRTTNGTVEISGAFGDVKAASTNGAIRLQGATGTITLSTTNGTIRAVDVKGRLRADTTNGGITIEMPKVEADIEADTTNGSIHLRLGEQPNADLKARTTNGRINLDFPVTVQGLSGSRRRIEGTIGSGGPLISLETTNGSITISR